MRSNEELQQKNEENKVLLNRRERFGIERQDSDYDSSGILDSLDRWCCSIIGLVVIILLIWLIIEL